VTRVYTRDALPRTSQRVFQGIFIHKIEPKCSMTAHNKYAQYLALGA
jgi:hypothetical protein